MAELHEAIRTRLLADANVLSLTNVCRVGAKELGDPSTALVYITVSENVSLSLDSEYCRARIQISALSNVYDDAFKLRKYVTNSLHRFVGTLSGIQIIDILRVDGAKRDQLDPESGEWHCIQDFYVRYDPGTTT